MLQYHLPASQTGLTAVIPRSGVGAAAGTAVFVNEDEGARIPPLGLGVRAGLRLVAGTDGCGGETAVMPRNGVGEAAGTAVFVNEDEGARIPPLGLGVRGGLGLVAGKDGDGGETAVIPRSGVGVAAGAAVFVKEDVGARMPPLGLDVRGGLGLIPRSAVGVAAGTAVFVKEDVGARMPPLGLDERGGLGLVAGKNGDGREVDTTGVADGSEVIGLGFDVRLRGTDGDRVGAESTVGCFVSFGSGRWLGTDVGARLGISSTCQVGGPLDDDRIVGPVVADSWLGGQAGLSPGVDLEVGG
jgi:hypothetical protein